jgi:hypothetical protein
MPTMGFEVSLQFTPPDGPCVTGWWADEATADRKWRSWVGTHGSHPTACIRLAEQTAAGPVPVKTWTRETGEVPGAPGG